MCRRIRRICRNDTTIFLRHVRPWLLTGRFLASLGMTKTKKERNDKVIYKEPTTHEKPSPYDCPLHWRRRIPNLRSFQRELLQTSQHIRATCSSDSFSASCNMVTATYLVWSAGNSLHSSVGLRLLPQGASAQSAPLWTNNRQVRCRSRRRGQQHRRRRGDRSP
jgi:hypothetical protein